MAAPKIIIPWNGAHASIPANWTRYTALDGRYPKASASDLGGQAGASTHSHTGGVHTHSYASNGHSHTTGNITGATVHKTDAQHQDAPDQEVSTTGHIHSSKSTVGFTGSSISSDGFTTGNANNEYSRYHFIFLQGSVYLPLPSNTVVMRDTTESRQNSAHFNDMDGRYMKGAGTGQDAGSPTDVGSHTHTQSHSHTMIHTHGSVNSGGISSGLLGGKDIPSSSPGNHSHTVSFGNHTENPNNTDNVPAETADLRYKELHFWETSGKANALVGDIVMTDEATVPVGWEDLAYDDFYIKGKAEGQALSTGGSNTHNHPSLSHTHVGTSHTHSWTTNSVGGSNAYRNGGSSNITGSHSHSGTTSAATNSTTGSTSASISTENHEPLHTKLKFIKLNFQLGGAALFAMA